MSTIAEKIKAYRAKHNLTQEKFAERVGLTQGAISMLESGKGLSAQTLVKIHKGTGGELSPDALLLPDSAA